MIIVPNEWLVELLLGSKNDQRVVHGFLDRVEAEERLLGIRRHGRLAQKILSAMADPHARAKRLKLILFEESKVRLVEEQEIVTLPQELQAVVPSDDLYLVETAFSVKPCVVVTTDTPLRDILVGYGNSEIQVRLLDEYLGEGGPPLPRLFRRITL